MFFQFVSSLDIDDAVTAYNAADNSLRLFAYEPIRQQFKDVLDKGGGKKFDEMFPQPAGYDQFVEQMKREYLDEQKTPAEPVGED